MCVLNISRNNIYTNIPYQISCVSIIQETMCFTAMLYTYNSNSYSSLIWQNFCVLPNHMYKSSRKCRVLWGRNIRDLVHNWRFNYPYEVSWIWINILCSSNSCFFHFAKQMISEFWPASGAIWMLNVNLKFLIFLKVLYFLLQVCGSVILGVSVWIRVSKDVQQVSVCSHTRTM